MTRTIRTTAAAGLVAISASFAAFLTPTVPARAAETVISCIPVEVAVFATGSRRIHVRCAAAVGGISYFVISTNDAPVAARVLSMLTRRRSLAGRSASVTTPPTSAAAPSAVRRTIAA